MTTPMQANHLRLEIMLRQEIENTGSILGADRTNHSKWQAYEQAVKSFNDFILNGKVPADLTSDTSARAVGA